MNTATSIPADAAPHASRATVAALVPDSPWHVGEVELQRHIGVAERMAELGPRSIRDHLIEQHRTFFPQLPFVAMGSVAPDGQVWATLVAAHPGFLQATDEHTLTVRALPDRTDPVRAGIAEDASIAMLGIELHTRRRNRLNGVVTHLDERGFDLSVRESFGNCPKYIQRRDPTWAREPGEPAPFAPVESDHLSGAAQALVREADTFFVATYVDGADGARRVDVSHRGGKPGLVRIGDDGVLTVPDFVGNRFFSTLGNIRVNPKAGLVFVDFETGDLVQITGSAEVVLDAPEIEAFEGAERLWRVTPSRVIYRPAALPLRLAIREDGWSPQALATGDWASVAARLAAV